MESAFEVKKIKLHTVLDLIDGLLVMRYFH